MDGGRDAARWEARLIELVSDDGIAVRRAKMRAHSEGETLFPYVEHVLELLDALSLNATGARFVNCGRDPTIDEH
jgi:hypothetical protein